MVPCPYSSNHYILYPNEFSLEFWLAIFEEHCDDFSKICIQFVESLSLRMGPRKTWYISDVQTRFRTPFHNCLISLHRDQPPVALYNALNDKYTGTDVDCRKQESHES